MKINDGETRMQYIGRMVKSGYTPDQAKELWDKQVSEDDEGCLMCGG